MTIYIPIPIEQELPKEEGHYHVIIKGGRLSCSNFRRKEFWNNEATHWLKPVELCTQEEIEDESEGFSSYEMEKYGFRCGANYILDKIK